MKKRWIFKAALAAVLFLLAAGPGSGAGPIVGPKGTVCWVPPTIQVDGTPLTDLAGYNTYTVDPTGKTTKIDVGKVTAPPTPPFPSQACAAGSVGVIRDQTGQVDGQYAISVSAYNTSGTEGPQSNIFPFVLKGTLNLVAPGAPTQGVSK